MSLLSRLILAIFPCFRRTGSAATSRSSPTHATSVHGEDDESNRPEAPPHSQALEAGCNPNAEAGPSHELQPVDTHHRPSSTQLEYTLEYFEGLRRTDLTPEKIQVFQHAFDSDALKLEDPQIRPLILVEIASAYHRFYTAHKDDVSLDQCIATYRRALRQTPEDSPYRLRVVVAALRALSVVPEGDIPKFLGFLGALSQDTFSSTDLAATIQHVADSIEDESEGVSSRFHLAMDAIPSLIHLVDMYPITEGQTGGSRVRLAQRLQLLDICQSANALLPRLALFGGNSTKLRDLLSSETVGMEGARLALSLDRPDVAVELLEQARGAFWAQALRLRPLLEGVPQELSIQLEQLAMGLETSARSWPTDAVPPPFHSFDGDQRYEQNVESSAFMEYRFRRLVSDIRKLPGLDRFLLPDTYSALGHAADRGPAVILLPGDTSSYAILIPRPSSNPSYITLDISSARLKALGETIRRENEKFGRDIRVDEAGNVGAERASSSWTSTSTDPLSRILTELWRVVLRPIIEVLSLKKSQGVARPRVFLVPSGPFTFLPLHAAGRYADHMHGNWECCSDYMVTSYTPTLRTLLRHQQHKSPDRSCDIKPSAIVVAEPNAPKPGFSPLPQTTVEVAAVKHALPSYWTCLPPSQPDKPGSTVSEVTEHLANASILHIACHGSQDARDALSSGFWLSDGQLTVATLMEHNLSASRAAFAFLSACETAKGDEEQPDQAVHLAGSMLFVGFKSIVGTLWSMQDVDGPVVAAAVYEKLFEGGMFCPENVPYALDDAVCALRRKGVSPSRWALFVHFGL